MMWLVVASQEAHNWKVAEASNNSWGCVDSTAIRNRQDADNNTDRNRGWVHKSCRVRHWLVRDAAIGMVVVVVVDIVVAAAAATAVYRMQCSHARDNKKNEVGGMDMTHSW